MNETPPIDVIISMELTMRFKDEKEVEVVPLYVETPDGLEYDKATIEVLEAYEPDKMLQIQFKNSLGTIYVTIRLQDLKKIVKTAEEH